MNQNNIVQIRQPEIFSFRECLWFLDRNYDDCLHVIDGDHILKAIEVNNSLVLFRISAITGFLQIEILSGPTDQSTKDFLARYVRFWFDMERDMRPFYRALKENPVFSYMAEEFFGLRMMGIESLFEVLCWSIIGQQINLTFAFKLKRRLVESYGKKVSWQGGDYFVFPEPYVLAQVLPDELRAFQFSQKKAEYIVNLAISFQNGIISNEIVAALPDFLARQQFLVSFKGIGIWTANYSLMKAFRESQGIPYGDIGLFNALQAHELIAHRKESDRIEELFSRFRGWESYLVFYLWRSLATKKLS